MENNSTSIELQSPKEDGKNSSSSKVDYPKTISSDLSNRSVSFKLYAKVPVECKEGINEGVVWNEYLFFVDKKAVQMTRLFGGNKKKTTFLNDINLIIVILNSSSK